MSISLQNIYKSFKDQKILNNLSLEIGEGETLVLFGPSGAGKSVLLRLIAGVIEPDRGRVFLNGKDMTFTEPEERGLGMAFQNFALFPHMTAADNIAAPLTARRQSRDRIESAVDVLARLLKIDHVIGHRPMQLSNGQKQRTALARALAGEPSILLLDDPLRNVDAKLRFEMRLELPRLLRKYRATVIYVTQDYKEAMALGDRIAVLDKGSVVQTGTPEEIYCRPANVTIARLFGDPAINLLEIAARQTASGAIEAQFSDSKLTLPPALAAYAGQPLLLGLRPETLRFVGAEAPGAIPVTLEAETPLNEKSVSLVVTRCGQELMLSRPAGLALPEQEAGQGTAHIAVTPESLLLFDAQTGRRIDWEHGQ